MAGPGRAQRGQALEQDWAWVSDEVYGTATGPGHGCPWGWARFIDIADPTARRSRASTGARERPARRATTFNPPRTSYSAHNPTLTPNIAFSTWHSGGLQAIGHHRPAASDQLAEFKPKPLTMVAARGPAALVGYLPGRTDNKVVMWSYPVIQDGLIYTVDLRNGLYILKYNGPYASRRSTDHLPGGQLQPGRRALLRPGGQPARLVRMRISTR